MNGLACTIRYQDNHFHKINYVPKPSRLFGKQCSPLLNIGDIAAFESCQ